MVSKETFQLQKCTQCDFVFTSPRPKNEDLGRYYESEDYISHSNTKASLFSKAYQWVRNRAIVQKRKWVESHTSRGSILDIGCGTGHFLNECKRNGWEIIGVEPSDIARANAFQEHEISPLKSIEETDGMSQTFDAITLWHVLEHLPDLSTQFLRFQKLLKPGGVVLIAVPNYESHDAKHYGSDWAAWDVPIHLWHFSKSTLGRLAEKNNFHVVETINMPFDSFYVSLLSEKYKHGSMRPIHAFIEGLKSNLAGRSTKNMSSLVYVLKKAI